MKHHKLLLNFCIVLFPAFVHADIFSAVTQDCIAEQITVQFPMYADTDPVIGIIDSEDQNNWEAQYVLTFDDGNADSVFVKVTDGNYEKAEFIVPGLNNPFAFNIKVCQLNERDTPHFEEEEEEGSAYFEEEEEEGSAHFEEEESEEEGSLFLG